MRKNIKRNAILACLSAGILVGAVGVVAATPVQASANTLVSQTMVMEEGAGLYLDEYSGLRFSYTVENYDENANYGMLIVPCDYLDDAGITDVTDTTKDYVKLLNAITFPDGDPIVEENLKPNAKGVFSCCVKDIREYNYAREFFGIGFVKTGDSYVYATQSDNVRSVFEVANLAANKLNYGEWDTSNAEEMAEKEKLAANEDGVINPFIEKAWAFAYGEGTTPTVEIDATYVNGETTPVITLPTSEKGIELQAHFNVVSIAGTSVAKMQDGKVKGVSRGQTKVSAKLGDASVFQRADVTVFQDETELAIYNNSGKADFFAEVSTNTNAFGTVSLDGGVMGSGSVYTKDSGYMAFTNPDAQDGKYTLDENGTYLDIYFTGNNMPNVEFFGNSISGNMWKDTTNATTGFVVSNGFGPEALYDNFATANALMNTTDYTNLNSKFQYNGIVNYQPYFEYGVSDYNKFSTGGASVKDSAYTLNMAFYSTNNQAWSSDDIRVKYSKFSMWQLMQDETKNWRYTVGMYKDGDGNVFVDSALYEVLADGTELAFSQYNAQVTTVTEAVSGYIVLHGALKGKDGSNYRATEYAYTLPYAGNADTRFVSSGATFNADGSVSLTASYGNTADYSKIINRTMGYIALDGSYGLGTYIDLYFTGSNMPMVSFFNKYVTNNATDYVDGTNTNAGILMFNSYCGATSASMTYYTYRYTVCGPNRINAALDSTRLYYEGGTTKDGASLINAKVLEDMPDQQFKYTVGFYLNADNKVCISVDVDKVDAQGNLNDYHSIDRALEVTEADIQGGRIIIYGGFNGNQAPTFRYSAPYTKAN